MMKEELSMGGFSWDLICLRAALGYQKMSYVYTHVCVSLKYCA